jgi:hypothetical protein
MLFTDWYVLFVPKAIMIEWLPFDEEFPILDGDRPYAERLLLSIDMLIILHQFYHAGMRIGMQGCQRCI